MKHCELCNDYFSANNISKHIVACNGEGSKNRKIQRRRDLNALGNHKCDECSRQFDTHRARAAHNRFCKRSWNEVGWAIKRNILIQEVNFKCSECGFDKTRKCGSSILEIDHIDGNHKNNSKDNLRVLCPNCHALTSNFRNWGRKSNKKTSARIRKGNKDFEKYQKERSTLKELKEEFNKKFVEKVKDLHESGEIDFSKFGWVEKLSERFGEVSQVTGRRLRRLMPEFYDEHCFRRGYSKYKNFNAQMSE